MLSASFYVESIFSSTASSAFGAYFLTSAIQSTAMFGSFEWSRYTTVFPGHSHSEVVENLAHDGGRAHSPLRPGQRLR